MKELTVDEIDQVSGGVLPAVALFATGFGKGLTAVGGVVGVISAGVFFFGGDTGGSDSGKDDDS